MKNGVFSLVLILFSLTVVSQNSEFEYAGRINPSVKKDKLSEVNFLSEITPELWGKLMLPFYDREELNHRKKTDFSQGFSIQKHEYDYHNIIEYVAVEITGTQNGKVVTSRSENDRLTAAQKEILKNAGLGSDINIRINFKFKNHADFTVENKIKEGNLTVSVVPETEAEYPGGFAQMTKYFTDNLFNKIPEKSSAEKILMASVKFTVNEEGRIIGSEISRSSSDTKTDRLILEATGKMPKWNPAKDANGAKVKQEFTIPFGGAGGC